MTNPRHAFQSTLPVRGETSSLEDKDDKATHFNPPSPCGEGPTRGTHEYPPFLFQSTLPVRGGTVGNVAYLFINVISIHPPRAGRDGVMSQRSFSRRDFNPPSPCGEGPKTPHY